MKKIFGVIALVGVLALTGCSGAYSNGTETNPAPEVQDQEDGELYEQVVTLNDGREITCIVFRGYQKGGLSCDWNSTESDFGGVSN